MLHRALKIRALHFSLGKTHSPEPELLSIVLVDSLSHLSFKDLPVHPPPLLRTDVFVLDDCLLTSD
jgi:hypothetical protein